MNKEAKPVRTSIYLSPETREALHRVAKAHKRSFNSEVVWALEYYLAAYPKEWQRDQKDV